MSIKQHHLENLSRAGFRLWIDDDLKFVIVEDVMLPPGYNRRSIPVLIELPPNYPQIPPGVGGYQIYVPRNIRYQEHRLKDIHLDSKPSFKTPGWDDWAWMCYERIDWDPCQDDLIALIETVRADLTNPNLK